jgi:hypothetical protein
MTTPRDTARFAKRRYRIWQKKRWMTYVHQSADTTTRVGPFPTSPSKFASVSSTTCPKDAPPEATHATSANASASTRRMGRKIMRETLRRALAKFRRKMKTSRRGVAVDAEQAMQSALALALCRRPARTSAAVLASAAEARLPETDEAWTGTTPGMGGRTPRTRMGERQMGARRTGGRVGTGGLAVVPRLLVTEDVFLGASTVPPVRPGQDAGGGLKRYGSERSGAGSRTRGRRIFSCCSV